MRLGRQFPKRLHRDEVTWSAGCYDNNPQPLILSRYEGLQDFWVYPVVMGKQRPIQVGKERLNFHLCIKLYIRSAIVND
jgi:hypothetical protein